MFYADINAAFGPFGPDTPQRILKAFFFKEFQECQKEDP